MATEGDGDYTVEDLDDSHVRITVDGEAYEVYVERRYSSHHHFGQFTSLDHLVEAIRRARRQQAEAAEELERLTAERDQSTGGK